MAILSFAFILAGCSKKIACCIDWMDFVRFNDIWYMRVYSSSNISENLIDKKIGEIKFQVSENVHDPNYKTKNGDAAFSKKGTELYKLKDYNKNFRIAARVDNKYYLYQVYNNPRAKKFKDILDIENKVIYIGINSEKDGRTELAAIKDENKVKLLVDMLLNSYIKKANSNLEGANYFIEFHLKDGTSVIEQFALKSTGKFSEGEVPQQFTDEIRNSLDIKK